MGCIYLPGNASKARQRDAERARKNRAEIVRELSWGRVSRRDLIKWGLFTSAGLLAPIGGLNPFVGTVSADGDSGMPRSPLFGATPFTQPMPRFDVLSRHSEVLAAERRDDSESVLRKGEIRLRPAQCRYPGREALTCRRSVDAFALQRVFSQGVVRTFRSAVPGRPEGL